MPRWPASDTEYLQKLQDYYARHRVFPSYSAIGRIVGLKSTSSVAAWIERLRAAGYVELKERRLRPSPRFFDRAMMASHVAAGLPAMAFDAPAEGLEIDAQLIRHPSRTFLLKVRGESMIDAGLLPGDMLVVEKADSASAGDIVVAMIEEGCTVKRLVRENRRFVLKPENKNFPVLRPEPLQILGIVVGSFRNYR